MSNENKKHHSKINYCNKIIDGLKVTRCGDWHGTDGTDCIIYLCEKCKLKKEKENGTK